MNHLHRRVRFSLLLCLAALPAGIAAHLALTDIWHGEVDLSLEWNVLRVSGLIVAVALLAAMRTLFDVLQAGDGVA